MSATSVCEDAIWWTLTR